MVFASLIVCGYEILILNFRMSPCPLYLYDRNFRMSIMCWIWCYFEDIPYMLARMLSDDYDEGILYNWAQYINLQRKRHWRRLEETNHEGEEEYKNRRECIWLSVEQHPDTISLFLPALFHAVVDNMCQEHSYVCGCRTLQKGCYYYECKDGTYSDPMGGNQPVYGDGKIPSFIEENYREELDKMGKLAEEKSGKRNYIPMFSGDKNHRLQKSRGLLKWQDSRDERTVISLKSSTEIKIAAPPTHLRRVRWKKALGYTLQLERSRGLTDLLTPECHTISHTASTFSKSLIPRRSRPFFRKSPVVASLQQNSFHCFIDK